MGQNGRHLRLRAASSVKQLDYLHQHFTKRYKFLNLLTTGKTNTKLKRLELKDLSSCRCCLQMAYLARKTSSAFHFALSRTDTKWGKIGATLDYGQNDVRWPANKSSFQIWCVRFSLLAKCNSLTTCTSIPLNATNY